MNRSNHAAFQKLEIFDYKMDAETKLHLLTKLTEYQALTIYPTSLDLPTTTELKFETSPSDLLYNLIEVRRVTQAMLLARIGAESFENYEWLPVSDSVPSSHNLTGSES